jgi:tetratricopeptide (TPR) repeat protein
MIAASAMGASILFTGMFTGVPAHAAGGSSSDSTPSCANGKVYDKKTKKCVPKEASLDQDSFFETGRALAYSGNYQEAINILKAAPQKDDERVLNMLGFAHRKLGKTEIAVAYYKHSISLNPRYELVREYYGEALLGMGDLSAAHNQLDAIAGICGRDCESYQALHAAISAHELGLPADQQNLQRW